MVSSVGISQERVHSIITVTLAMEKVKACCFPKLLSSDEKRARHNIERRDVLAMIESVLERFLQQCLSFDETRADHWENKNKNSGSI